MRLSSLSEVSAAMDELQRRIDELQRRIDALLYANAYDPIKGTVQDGLKFLSGCPKETGAVRRQSMELTRALAELRRS